MTVTAPTRRSFEVRAIDPAVLAGFRALDNAGQAPRLLVDADGGAPLRAACGGPAGRADRAGLLRTASPLGRADGG